MISDEILTIIDLFFLHRKPGLNSCIGKHFLLRSYSKGLVLPNGFHLIKGIFLGAGMLPVNWMACIFMFQVENVIVQLNQSFPADGLLPIYVNPHRGTSSYSTITFGAMGDRYSPFEILLWFTLTAMSFRFN